MGALPAPAAHRYPHRDRGPVPAKDDHKALELREAKLLAEAMAKEWSRKDAVPLKVGELRGYRQRRNLVESWPTRATWANGWIEVRAERVLSRTRPHDWITIRGCWTRRDWLKGELITVFNGVERQVAAVSACPPLNTSSTNRSRALSR